jgi:hypothetical protein
MLRSYLRFYKRCQGIIKEDIRYFLVVDITRVKDLDFRTYQTDIYRVLMFIILAF